jgi:hypothetical protein
LVEDLLLLLHHLRLRGFVRRADYGQRLSWEWAEGGVRRELVADGRKAE